MLAAIAVFIIERQLMKAAVFALVGATLTFFGFMHGEAIGIGETPVVALAYVGVGGVLMWCARFAQVAPQTVATHEHEDDRQDIHGAFPEPVA